MQIVSALHPPPSVLAALAALRRCSHSTARPRCLKMPPPATDTTSPLPASVNSSPAPRARWDVSRFIPPTAGPDDVFVQIYCPQSPPPPIPPSLTPPPPTPHPPIIYHVLAPHGLTNLSPPTPLHFLHLHTHLPRSLLTELTDFGAVYLRAGIPNARTSPRATRLTTESANTPLPPREQIYMRVYASPKRHAATSALRVLRVVGDVAAVQKPKGLPVVPTADNAVECVTTLAAGALGVDKVYVSSRLDACTGGVLLLGLSTEGAKAANAMLRGEGCEKIYAVDTRAKPEVGVLRHWYNKKAKLGRGVVQTGLLKCYDCGEGCPGEGWVVAELVVVGVRRRGDGWRSDVRLVTGRTHQIRMQFAARGWAVCGDCKYLPVDGGVLDAREEGRELGQDPVAIGLCAVRVEGVLKGERVVFEAEVKEDEYVNWRGQTEV